MRFGARELLGCWARTDYSVPRAQGHDNWIRFDLSDGDLIVDRFYAFDLPDRAFNLRLERLGFHHTH